MFTLSFEKKYRVLKASFSGVLSSEDIQSSDRATLAFTALRGPNRGIIDFSDVEAIGVPRTRLLERGRQPQMMLGRERVMVVPRGDWADIAREFCEQQRLIGSFPPTVVSSIDEAYFILGLVDPIFEGVPG